MTDEARQRAGWTREKPTVPGWYWNRNTDNPTHAMVYVRNSLDIVEHLEVLVAGRYSFLERTCYTIEQISGEWRGPITPDDGEREYQLGLEAAAKAIDERIDYICHDYHEEPLGDLEWYHRDLLERTVEDLKAVLARLAQEARW